MSVPGVTLVRRSGPCDDFSVLSPRPAHGERGRYHGSVKLQVILKTVLVCTAFFVVGCSADEDEEAKKKEAQAKPAAVTVVEAVGRDVPLVVRAVGAAVAVDSVQLAFEAAGRVERIDFEEGARVNAGQVIARLDNDAAVAGVEAAQSRRDRAGRRLDQLATLVATNAVSADQVDEAQNVVAQEQAALDQAAETLENLTVITPFDGVLGLRQVSVGAYVQSGQQVTSLASVDPMELEYNVPERYYADLKPGQAVLAATPAYPGRVFTGDVYKVAPRVDPATRTVTVVARFKNPGGDLRPGMFMDCETRVGTRQNSVVLPEQSVSVLGTRIEAFVVTDGKAERRSVRLGRRGPGVVEVLEGVAAGERVITSDTETLKEGKAVEAKPDETIKELGIRLGDALDTNTAGLGAGARQGQTLESTTQPAALQSNATQSSATGPATTQTGGGGDE